MMDAHLSVVLPVYNEANVIGSTLETVAGYLAAAGFSHEILIVDDGSTDATLEIARSAARATPAIQVLAAEHRGKGAAVRRGMLEARGRYRLFLDADLSTDIREWEKCAPWLDEGFEVVIGSRKMTGAHIRVRQPWLREQMGKVFTRLTNGLLGARVSDITCGFKAFTGAAAQRIFRLQRMDGWGFDAEILFIARRLGYDIKEVPVVWADDASTKVHLLRDAARSFRELMAIRLGGWTGRYHAEKTNGRPR